MTEHDKKQSGWHVYLVDLATCIDDEWHPILSIWILLANAESSSFWWLPVIGLHNIYDAYDIALVLSFMNDNQNKQHWLAKKTLWDIVASSSFWLSMLL